MEESDNTLNMEESENGQKVEEIPEKRKLDDSESSNTGTAKKQAVGDHKVAVSVDTEANVPPITVHMACPQPKVGPLIGRKGAVIQEIMRQSGCKIQIDQNFPEGIPRQIQLTGTPKALSLAMQLVSQVLENLDANGNSSSTNYAPFMPHLSQPAGTHSEEDFFIPQDKVGSVIGQKGANINEIMKRTGCRIQIIQDGVPDGFDRNIQFTGTPEQIAEAKIMITTIINDGASALNISPPVPGVLLNGQMVVEEDINPDKVKVVIGPKGATVTHISRQSGCKILMNQKFPPGQPHKIIYTGTAHQIEIAKYMVENVLTQRNGSLQNAPPSSGNTVMQEMNVFQSQMVSLLGPHGANVSDVQLRCGVKINIDTTPIMLVGNNIGPSGLAEATNKVTVIGSSESVQHAVKILYESIGIFVAAPPSPPSAMMMQAPGGGQPHYPIMSYGAHPPYPPQQQQTIIPPVNSVGYVPVPMTRAHHMMQMSPPLMQAGGPPQMISSSGYPPMLSASVQMMSAALALGDDGTAGQLESAMQLTDGSYQQIAEIKSHALSKLMGKLNSNITLIMTKSGANIQILKADPMRGSTKLVLTASNSQTIQLASQMVQEILVNGVTKLQQMPDVLRSTLPPMPSSSGVPLMPPQGAYYPMQGMQPPQPHNMSRPPVMYMQAPMAQQQQMYMAPPQPGMMYVTQQQQQQPQQQQYGRAPLPQVAIKRNHW